MGPTKSSSVVFSKAIFWRKITNFQSTITFFLFGLWMWPRYGKDSIFHELFKKHHHGTPKRNKSNKNNSWRLASGIAGKSNIGPWHKNKASEAENMGNEAGNLQIYPFSWKRPKEFSRFCLCCVLQKINFLSFCLIFYPENQLKNGQNREILIFAIWASHESKIRKKWIFLEFCEFFEVFEGFSGLWCHMVVPREPQRNPLPRPF